MIESPCVKVCTLDPSGRVCLGCFRTLEEIGAWGVLSDLQRRDVMARLGDRKREHEAVQAAVAMSGTRQACERCGADFTCGAMDPSHPCWCAACPPVRPSGATARCLCPECLARAAMGEA